MIALKTKTLLATCLLGISFTAESSVVDFSDSLGDFSGPTTLSGFPLDLGVIGEFSFIAGNTLDAVVSGTWGNSVNSSSAPSRVFVDGILVASCITYDVCTKLGSLEWSYTFTASDLASGILDDGIAIVQVIQTSQATVRLGDLTISGRTQITNLPIPAAIYLFASGIIFVGVRFRNA